MRRKHNHLYFGGTTRLYGGRRVSDEYAMPWMECFVSNHPSYPCFWKWQKTNKQTSTHTRQEFSFYMKFLFNSFENTSFLLWKPTGVKTFLMHIDVIMINFHWFTLFVKLLYSTICFLGLILRAFLITQASHRHLQIKQWKSFLW